MKDQKLFSSAKPIDPVWLAQTKMETANIVNANKLLVYSTFAYLHIFPSLKLALTTIPISFVGAVEFQSNGCFFSPPFATVIT